MYMKARGEDFQIPFGDQAKYVKVGTEFFILTIMYSRKSRF